MKRAKKEYEYFLKALELCLGQWGAQNRAAVGADVSDGYISQIVNRKKHASFDVQVAIARAFEYEYIDFLKMGMPENKHENLEILRLLEKSKVILTDGNEFISDSFKGAIKMFEIFHKQYEKQSIRKTDPPEKKAEIIKLRGV
jgi:hypothetical protein